MCRDLDRCRMSIHSLPLHYFIPHLFELLSDFVLDKKISCQGGYPNLLDGVGMIDDPSLPTLINQSRHSLHPSHIAADHVGFNLIEWGQTYLPSRLKWKIDRAIGCNTSLENL